MATVIVSSPSRSKVPSQSVLRAVVCVGKDGLEWEGGGEGAALERAELFADGHTELNAPDLF